MPNSADTRKETRKQLFSGKAKKANSQGIFKDLDEEEWLAPNWATYAKLNFELPDPGPEGCLRELRKMVADKATPYYQGGKKGGTAKPIQSRPLGDLEHAKLRQLLEHYEKKWADMGAMGQALSSQINASAEDIKDTVREEAAKRNNVLQRLEAGVSALVAASQGSAASASRPPPDAAEGEAEPAAKRPPPDAKGEAEPVEPPAKRPRPRPRASVGFSGGDKRSELEGMSMKDLREMLKNCT